MISNNIPSNLGNLVAPFLPAGQRPVGQETADNRNSTFKPVEQAAKAAETRIQRKPEDERREERQRRKKAMPELLATEPDTEQPAPETPSSRLARRFASADTGSEPGSHFDQTI